MQWPRLLYRTGCCKRRCFFSSSVTWWMRNVACCARRMIHLTLEGFQLLNWFHFSAWVPFIDELKLKAQTLLRILHAVSSRKQNSESIQQHHPGICMAAVMLKVRNREMCGNQSLIPLLLYATHAEKQV